MRREDASAYHGVSTRTLHYWSNHALITRMIDSGTRRHSYMRPEITGLRRLALGPPITAKLIRQIVAYDIAKGADPIRLVLDL